MEERVFCELIRGVVLWIIWNERNRIIFKGGNYNTIISIAKFCGQITGQKLLLKLQLAMSFDVDQLPM